MPERASVGAKVLQTRSVGLAMKMGVRVQVLSSFVEGDEAPAKGTMIVSDEEIEEHQMERQLITGIAHDKNEAKIIVTRVPDKPGDRKSTRLNSSTSCEPRMPSSACKK